jgi:hypothetical protein
MVREFVPLRPMGSHTLKGKGAGIELFEIPDDEG